MSEIPPIVNAADFHVRPYAQGYKGFDWIKMFCAMQHENSPESQEWS